MCDLLSLNLGQRSPSKLRPYSLSSVILTRIFLSQRNEAHLQTLKFQVLRQTSVLNIVGELLRKLRVIFERKFNEI